jgi:hypothetical protein
MLVFIDTGVFKSAHFHFKTGVISELMNYAQNGLVKIILTPVLEAELRKHFEKEFNEVWEKYTFLKNKFLNYDIDCTDGLSDNDIEAKIRSSFNSFLSSPDHIMLALEEIDWEKILSDYQNNRAPFSNNKNDEFKDSLNIQLLNKYKMEISEKIHIVSTDKEFRDAFSELEGFEVYVSLKEFIPIVRALEPKYQHMEDLLKSYLLNHHFYEQVDHYLGDVNRYFPTSTSIRVKLIRGISDLNYSFSISSLRNNECEGAININGIGNVVFTNKAYFGAYTDNDGNPLESYIEGRLHIDTSIPFKVVFQDLQEFMSLSFLLEDNVTYDLDDLHVSVGDEAITVTNVTAFSAL